MITNSEYRSRLYGRETECETLAGLVGGVRRGHGAVLVVRGEPGSGKTALLDHAAGLAADLRVVRVAGAESEAELAYAGLCQLGGSMSGPLGRLPDPQRVALEIAFGVRTGPAPARCLLGLGALGLLTEAAADGPLVCVVDDAHWLDRESQQALAFAARRLAAESVLVIFASGRPGTDLTGLPELTLGGLPDTDARELLASVVRWPLDERVREQIVAETRGNPRALTEVPLALPPVRLAGGFGLPDAPHGRLFRSVLGQLADLPAQTRLLLLVAAADPTGDPVLVLRAAGNLGIGPEAAYPAAEAGLLTFGTRVVFREPGARSAAYQGAAPGDRRAAHRALAQATIQRGDQDRRAWHRAKAAAGLDEDVAIELERTAGQAQARGGLPASAAFLERAVLLTRDAYQRSRRALAAATAMLHAGEPDGAAKLIDVADSGVLDDQWQARADLVRARLAFAQHRSGHVPRLLLDAAARLGRSDAAPVRAAYLDAIRAVTRAGGLTIPGGTVADVARAASNAPDPGRPGPADLLLDGLAAYLSGEQAAGAPILRQALNGFGAEMTAGVTAGMTVGMTAGVTCGVTAGVTVGMTAAEQLRWLPLACTGAQYLWDDLAWDSLSSRYVELARAAGALGELPLALDSLACLHLLGGELSTAESLTAEARAVAETMGNRPAPYGALGLAAVRGHRDVALEMIDRAAQDAALRDEGLGVAAAKWAAAMLHNGLGQYDAALSAAEDAVVYAGPSPVAGWPAAELIEAAARAGEPGRAAGAMRCLARAARAAGTDWAHGIRARSLALLSDGEAAEDLYQAAIGHLGRSCARVDLARAHLLYGEWLRRENRRVDAREQLSRAHGTLRAIGADGFAERARRELLATGQTVRKRTRETDRNLTAQETQIAARARDGQTNTEIGAELFLSPRTVEWHLRKVFAKLGITSRRQLRQTLPGAVAMSSG
jgi:DNA-binding CsgD family transcriptional regulator/tetratricopeptide (TPR) repeat protein